MEDYIIGATKTTPGVEFDASTGVLWLEGESYPENAVKFYEPLCDWLEHFAQEHSGPINLHIKLSYCNSSSSKCLLDILEILEKASEKNAITVHWYYRENDLDILESGQEFAEDMNLDFKYIAF